MRIAALGIIYFVERVHGALSASNLRERYLKPEGKNKIRREGSASGKGRAGLGAAAA